MQSIKGLEGAGRAKERMKAMLPRYFGAEPGTPEPPVTILPTTPFAPARPPGRAVGRAYLSYKELWMHP